MRKISVPQALTFMLMAIFSLLLAVTTDVYLLGGLPLGDFRGVVLALAGLSLFYIFAILSYRGFMAVFPLLPGDIPQASEQEFVYHVHLLFFLMLFYPVMRSGFMPVPMLRLFYQALGATFGDNSYTAGILYDPRFVSLGNSTLVGQGALLIPHAIEGKHLAHQPITLGNNVTIGVYAVILGGTRIDDGAIIAAGSVVGKGSHIGADEVWGGVPARPLKHRKQN